MKLLKLLGNIIGAIFGIIFLILIVVVWLGFFGIIPQGQQPSFQEDLYFGQENING